MTHTPNVASVQDMPPRGGYPPINFARGARPRGPPGWAIWGGIIGMTVYGFYQIGVTNAEKRHVLKEKREARMAIMPFLQTELDTMALAEIKKAHAREGEIMKHVEGWKVGESVYDSNGKRWVKSTHGLGKV